MVVLFWESASDGTRRSCETIDGPAVRDALLGDARARRRVVSDRPLDAERGRPHDVAANLGLFRKKVADNGRDPDAIRITIFVMG
jgi:hypothetical protein